MTATLICPLTYPIDRTCAVVDVEAGGCNVVKKMSIACSGGVFKRANVHFPISRHLGSVNCGLGLGLGRGKIWRESGLEVEKMRLFNNPLPVMKTSKT